MKDEKGAGKMTGKEALEIIVRKHCVSETDEEDTDRTYSLETKKLIREEKY